MGNNDVESRMWILGVCINIVGAVTTNLGTVLLKYHTVIKKGNGHSLKLGTFLFCLGTVLTFTSFSFAAQTLLAGISAVQFVSNLGFSYFLLKDPLTKRSFFGTFVLVCALMLLVFSSEKNSGIDTVEEVFEKFYFSNTHLIYISAILSAVLVLSLIFYLRTSVFPLWSKRSAKEEILVWELSLPRSTTKFTHFWLPFVFISTAAMIGTQSVVSGKSLSVVLRCAIADGDGSLLLDWRALVVMLIWIFSSVLWVLQLNRALRIFAGGFIIPLTQVGMLIYYWSHFGISTCTPFPIYL